MKLAASREDDRWGGRGDVGLQQVWRMTAGRGGVEYDRWAGRGGI